jgi:hypothetical protein
LTGSYEHDNELTFEVYKRQGDTHNPEKCDMGTAVKYLHSRKYRKVRMFILFGKSKQFTSLSFVPDPRVGRI